MNSMPIPKRFKSLFKLFKILFGLYERKQNAVANEKHGKRPEFHKRPWKYAVK